MSAYRTVDPARFQIDLAHGSPEQGQYDIFRRQHLIHPLRRGAWDQFRFIQRGRRWLTNHAGDYDILHGMSAYEFTVRPA